MTDASELRTVVEFVVTAFQREDVTYFISGSLASSVHGEFRATNGVDIVAALEKHHLPGLMGGLSGEFIADLHQAVWDWRLEIGDWRLEIGGSESNLHSPLSNHSLPTCAQVALDGVAVGESVFEAGQGGTHRSPPLVFSRLRAAARLVCR